jgi:hypothetical protein
MPDNPKTNGSDESDEPDEHRLAALAGEDRNRRRRMAQELIHHAEGVPFWKRVWFRLSEIADEYARVPGMLTIDQSQRELIIEQLRRAIAAREFVDVRGRSEVLNLHEAPHAGSFRFDFDGARNAHLFGLVTEHLWIKRKSCVAWFARHKLNLPPALAFGASPKLATPLEKVISKRMAGGDQPGVTVPWARFCERIRDDCDG